MQTCGQCLVLREGPLLFGSDIDDEKASPAQGCHILLYTIYQIGENIPNCHYNNDQIAIKYIN
jgi:hypothetical protein